MDCDHVDPRREPTLPALFFLIVNILQHAVLEKNTDSKVWSIALLFFAKGLASNP